MRTIYKSLRKSAVGLCTFLFLAGAVNAQVTVTLTLNCNGSTGSYASGSVNSGGTINDGNMTTINSSTNRGWAKFDLSFLPAGATITAATALFTTYSSTASSATNNVYGFTGDPATMSGATLYSNCANGTSFNASSWTANALQTKALNATGISFLQANIGNTNVNLGYVRGSTNTYNIYGYPGRSISSQPQLQITYTIASAIPSSATTLPASNVLVSSATLRGGITVQSTQPNSVSVTGIVLSTSASPTVGGFGVTDSSTRPLINSGTITLNFAGLTLGTLYHYRAYVIDTIGTSPNISYGGDSTFTTPATAPPPTVQRNVATNLQALTATIGGTIISNGGIPIIESGVVYSLTNNPLRLGSGVVDSTTTPVVTSGSYSFNLVGLTQSTKYYFRAYAVNASGTSYSSLDSFTTAPIISTFPYAENFDGVATTGWSSVLVSGSINEWVLGTPAKTQLSGAYSSTKCWVTKTTGNYSDNHDGAVVSPRFDCTSLTADPILRFRQNFITEPGWDGMVVEISINGGTWTKLDATLGTGTNFNTTNSISWYNSSSTSGPMAPPKWSENSNLFSSVTSNWIQSKTILTGAAGQANVKFRLRFASDGSGNDQGWAFDNVEVFTPSAPVLNTGTKSIITTVSATLAGTITSDGGNPVTASGVVVGLIASPVRGGSGVTDSATNPLVSNGSFSVNVAGLSPATTYHYRAYAVNGVGTTYGADSTFTTNASAVAPTVNRTAATAITAFAAGIGGNITSDGGSAVFASGVVYATTPTPVRFGTGVVDSTTAPVVSSGSYGFTVGGLTPGTKYYYRAYAVNSVGTSYSAQDSFTTAPVISTFPYTENFDGVTNTGWTSAIVTGSLNEWVLGTPAKTQLSGAYSSTKCWVTKLTGNYSDNQDAAVISPQLDCSALTANPILRFRHNFITEANWDGMVVEISINGGSWTKLDATLGTGTNFNTTNSIAWYNNSSTSGPMAPPKFSQNSNLFSSVSSNWIQSKTILTGAAGQANVKFRIRFASDGSGNDQGWAFDNVEVFIPTAPVVSSGTKTNKTTNSITLAGNITSDGGNAVTASGVVVDFSASPVRGGSGVVDSATNPLVSGGAFTVNITGLLPATTYHYRAYAVNPLGTSYGADSTFTTNATAVAPSISSVAASNVGLTSARMGGNITSDGGATIFASGVVYATTPNPVQFGSGVVDSATSPVVTSGTFLVNPTGLTNGTKYYYRAYATNSAGTTYSTQDSFLTSPIITSLPYTQNFDAWGNTGWSSAIVSGSINEWVLGTPAKAQLSGAYSAPNCWVTKLSGTYSDNQNAAVVSPQFDFSSLTSDPVLSFRHNFVTEANWDGSVIEVSRDGGLTWVRVDSTLGTGTNFNTPNSYSWYNNSSTSGPMTPAKWSQNSNLFSTVSSNWVLSQTRLTGTAGQANVKVRIRFASDGSGNDQGWAFDNVNIFNVVAPTTQASAVTIGTITSTSVNVSWTNGNRNARIVVARPTTATGVDPSDWTMYTANSVFGTGSATGTNNYVVYNGTGNSVTVTGLTLLTNYTFSVYELNGTFMHVVFKTPAATNNATTLPVHLLGFSATAIKEDVVLNWSTASELNNAGFEVENSVNGSDFQFVQFVKGAGTSTSKLFYSSIDGNAFEVNHADVLYYRLKQMDFDGRYVYTPVAKVQRNQHVARVSVSLYPNPSAGICNLAIVSAKNAKAVVTITDARGVEITHFASDIVKGNNTRTLDALEHAANGVYFVKVTLDGESTVTRFSKVN